MGDRCRRVTRMLDEHVGEPALVDHVEGVALEPEGGPEAGRGGRFVGARRRGGRVRVEDGARRLGRGALQDLCRADDRRSALDQLTGELSEEAPPAEIRAGIRVLGGRRFALGKVRRAGFQFRGVGHLMRPCRAAQYLTTLVTRRPSSRSRPLRKSSSTRNARPTTSPFSRSISSIVPLTVPPVASRSSTMRTFWPWVMASRWISSVFDPYSSAYSTVIVSAGSLPSLRTGTSPALSS